MTSPTFIAYHGTKASFNEFRTPAWFTPNIKAAEMFAGEWGDGEVTPDSKVITVEITLNNPVRTSDWSVTEPGKEMLEKYQAWAAEGHDGIHFESEEGEIEYIVFHHHQIKILCETRVRLLKEGPSA
jgi:hypothetical protein